VKKYLQITVVLGVFAFLVFLRQLKSGGQPVVVANQNNNNSSPSQSSQSTPQNSQPSTPNQSSNSSSNSMTPTSTPTVGAYKNGAYTGSVQDAFYGNIQVQVVISGGKITNVIFLQYPNDNRTSQYINSQADPMLTQETIQAQSAQINGVSGASASSQAFQASLADALSQAK
jgi:uncharacterized protein with FMN-binding domain